jgi:hypothetical protein
MIRRVRPRGDDGYQLVKTPPVFSGGLKTSLSGDFTAIHWTPLREGFFMSFVTTHPEALASTAGALQGIGSAMSAHNAAAVAPTTGVVPAAADEVSALTAAQFATHAQMYQAVSAQAAAIHEMFENTLGTSAGSYAVTEAANAIAAG